MIKKMIHDVTFELPSDLIINPEGDLLLIDKPYKCTSFDVVGRVRRHVQRAVGHKVKVGHAGTLDPLATGLLLICVGKMTKQVDVLQSQEKTYTGTFIMGATTPSFDLEKPVDATYPYEHITKEMAEEAAKQFTGDLQQVPPMFSAVKHQGERSYEIARRGEEAQLAPKNITIYEFEITRFELPEIDFRIRCSKGTYIRSIARDFGQALGSGAHLSALRRTRIGSLCVEDAIKPKILEK
jgi:tRNA pseudouridine55 synthase